MELRKVDKSNIWKIIHLSVSIEQEDFVAIRDWLAGTRRYYLQAYRDSEHILKPGNYSSYSREELERFAAILKEKIPVVEVRGIE